MVMLILPMVLYAQPMQSKKNKNIIIFLQPLHGQSENFEKGLTHHTNTFHSNNPIDVFEVLTGEQTGQFAFVYRNLYTWTEVDEASKSAEDKDHADDWNQNVAKFISNVTPRNFYEGSEDSYLPDNFKGVNTEMSAVYVIDLVQGKENDFYAGVKKIKEMYKKSNSKNYYILQTRVFGKGSQVMVVIPLEKGWASFDPSPDDDWEKMFKKAFPKEDFKAWIKSFEATQKTFDSFVVKLRKDLSSAMQ
ncbi:MAG: hypothetical protein E6Q58_04125 [Niabella sp.]|nr:MAG: hypothetical protein E6Q58_04125 [Niabella sp.]